MYKPVKWAAPSIAALSLVLALPSQAGSTQNLAPKKPASSASYYLSAQVIPASYVAVGSSLTGGADGTKYGDALSANGINNDWDTGSYTIDFAVLVFSSQAESGNVEFKVVSPSNATIYTYSWPSDQIPKGTDWFTVGAKANFTAPGLYFAEWDFNGKLDGWAPLNFSA